jgi:hypothetical protein
MMWASAVREARLKVEAKASKVSTSRIHSHTHHHDIFEFSWAYSGLRMALQLSRRQYPHQPSRKRSQSLPLEPSGAPTVSFLCTSRLDNIRREAGRTIERRIDQPIHNYQAQGRSLSSNSTLGVLLVIFDHAGIGSAIIPMDCITK